VRYDPTDSNHITIETPVGVSKVCPLFEVCQSGTGGIYSFWCLINDVDELMPSGAYDSNVKQG
jgi:hypothetical protein